MKKLGVKHVIGELIFTTRGGRALRQSSLQLPMQLDPLSLTSPLEQVRCVPGLPILFSLTSDPVVVIQDHFALPNLTGMNPSFGPLISPEYPRFFPLGDAYSVNLRRLAFLAAHKLQFSPDAVTEGTYAWVAGPAYETPAEGRFLRNIGAHVVGMSTIPEVVAAREEGLEVMVMSLVTNVVVIPDKYRSIKAEVEAEVREA
jgi:purine nucleoside phosphorylase